MKKLRLLSKFSRESGDELGGFMKCDKKDFVHVSCMYARADAFSIAANMIETYIKEVGN